MLRVIGLLRAAVLLFSYGSSAAVWDLQNVEEFHHAQRFNPKFHRDNTPLPPEAGTLEDPVMVPNNTAVLRALVDSFREALINSEGAIELLCFPEHFSLKLNRTLLKLYGILNEKSQVSYGRGKECHPRPGSSDSEEFDLTSSYTHCDTRWRVYGNETVFTNQVMLLPIISKVSSSILTASQIANQTVSFGVLSLPFECRVPNEDHLIRDVDFLGLQTIDDVPISGAGGATARQGQLQLYEEFKKSPIPEFPLTVVAESRIFARVQPSPDDDIQAQFPVSCVLTTEFGGREDKVPVIRNGCPADLSVTLTDEELISFVIPSRLLARSVLFTCEVAFCSPAFSAHLPLCPTPPSLRCDAQSLLKSFVDLPPTSSKVSAGPLYIVETPPPQRMPKSKSSYPLGASCGPCSSSAKSSNQSNSRSFDVSTVIILTLISFGGGVLVVSLIWYFEARILRPKWAERQCYARESSEPPLLARASP